VNIVSCNNKKPTVLLFPLFVSVILLRIVDLDFTELDMLPLQPVNGNKTLVYA
jgi:hypothetical protein